MYIVTLKCMLRHANDKWWTTNILYSPSRCVHALSPLLVLIIDLLLDSFFSFEMPLESIIEQRDVVNREFHHFCQKDVIRVWILSRKSTLAHKLEWQNGNLHSICSLLLRLHKSKKCNFVSQLRYTTVLTMSSNFDVVFLSLAKYGLNFALGWKETGCIKVMIGSQLDKKQQTIVKSVKNHNNA